MASSLTSQAVLSSIHRWKPVDQPTIPSVIPKSSKKELKDAYTAYKKEFNADKTRIKSIVKDIFESGGLKLSQKWNYRSS